MNSRPIGILFPPRSSFPSTVTLHSATLRHDDTSAEFDASAMLQHGHLTGDSLLSLFAPTSHNADLATSRPSPDTTIPSPARPIFLFRPPELSPILTVKAKSMSPMLRPTVRPFSNSIPPSMSSSGEFAFDNIHLLHDDSVITGSAAYNPSSRAFASTSLAIISISPASAQIHSNRLSVEGRADFALKGSGTPDAPSIHGDVHVQRPYSRS